MIANLIGMRTKRNIYIANVSEVEVGKDNTTVDIHIKNVGWAVIPKDGLSLFVYPDGIDTFHPPMQNPTQDKILKALKI